MNLAIVGAGIAGLTAGIYALRSGFDVTIYESHSAPGGASTCWRRGAYLFEGGLHWLNGSSPGTSLHKIWRDIGALDEHTPVYNRDPFFVVDYQGRRACLYRDIEKLTAHLLAVSPEDRREILRLVGDIKKFAAVDLPVGDLRGLKTREKSGVPLSSFVKMIPAFTRLPFWSGQTVEEYAKRFKSSLLRGLVSGVLRVDNSALSLIFTLAALCSGDGGYPQGGSGDMVLRIAAVFKALGGTIRFNSPVNRVVIQGGAAAGVCTGGPEIPAGAVIVTQDTLTAVDTLFDTPLREGWIEKMRGNTRPMVSTFISLGIEADLSALPESLAFFPEKPLLCGGREIRSLNINNYAAYAVNGPGGTPGYAPEGCSAVTSLIPGDNYDFWKRRREDGSYGAEKRRLAENFIEALGKLWPQIRGKIAVWDVATPLTYERYLHSYRGSYMSIMEKGMPPLYPVKPKTVKNLYFAGQRLIPPGGLPVAAETARKAVQYLCLDTGAVFQGGPGSFV
ncbi:MAG: NAD(P)/FAD-dependent oxidoreductase [Treponema sp.]|jgi:phytoene dehydrogenase-like protein|nr:NAD(P)/FAD-dependent oxidoreductase [Treponema sp.]